MAKEKTFKKNLDNITLKKLKYVIIVCFVACIICEFAPDILETCKWFICCSFFSFFQHHKDFFTNVSLGCLGSAVISYLILQIQIKTIEKEKKEKLNIILKKAVSKYWYLIFAITNNNIKNENEDLKVFIEEFINLYEESGMTNKFFQDYIEIFMNEVLPIVNEVDMFLDSFHLMVNKEDIVRLYDQEVYSKAVKQIYDQFYDLLKKKFQLQEINEKLLNINFANDTLIEEIEKLSEMIHNSSNMRKNAIGSLQYSNMIVKILAIENLKKLENEVPK